MLVNILSYCLFGFAILCGYLGYRRGRKEAVLRLVTVLASVVLAYILSKPLADGISTAQLTNKIPQLTDLLDSVPSLMPFVLAVFRPFVFSALFFALYLATWLVYRVLSDFITYAKNESFRPLLAAGIGALQGLLIAVVLLTPMLGYVSVADEAITAYAEAGGETTQEESSYDLATLQKEHLTPVLEDKLLSNIAEWTSPLFAKVSTSKINGKEIVLSEELPVLLRAAAEFSTLTGKDVKDFGEKEKVALRALVSLLDDSEFVPSVTAELVASVSHKWNAEGSFLTIKKPTLEGDLDVIVSEALNILAKAKAATIQEDFETLVELFVLMIDYDLLATEGGDELFDKATAVNPATGKTFISDAGALLDANPRFADLRRAVTDLGARMLVSQLGTSSEIRENCEEMADELVSILKDAEGSTNEEKIAAITPTLREELENTGITVPDQVVNEASRYLLDELAEQGKDLGTLTTEDIFNIFDALIAANAS